MNPRNTVGRAREDQVVRRRREGEILLGVILPRHHEQLLHLGREDTLAAVLGVEEIAEPALGTGRGHTSARCGSSGHTWLSIWFQGPLYSGVVLSTQ